MREVLAQHLRPRLGSHPAPRCVLLLATDRPRVLDLWLNRSLHEFNCTTVSAEGLGRGGDTTHTVHCTPCTYIRTYILHPIIYSNCQILCAMCFCVLG